MKLILVVLIVLAFAKNSSSQEFIFNLMDRTDISINEANRLATLHFDSAGTDRGTGYKHFQRWLYERRFHTDEKGYFISAQTEWNNYMQSRNSLLANRAVSANWTQLGPFTWNRTTSWNPGTGRLAAFAIHPSNESIIYVGSPGGGIWKTTNGGTTWQPLTDNNSTRMSIFALTIDPANQNIVYAGTTGSNGLLKSTDGGATWNLTGSGPTGTIRKILIHPTSTNIVFACATNGIYRSTNSGTSWTQVHSGSKEDIEFKPDDVNIMYATGNDVFRSTNNGVSWTSVGSSEGITNTGRTLVAVTAADPNYVYIVQANGSLFGRMYKSTNAGVSFTTTVIGNPTSGTNYFGYETSGTGTTGQATHDMALDVSPTNKAEVYIAGIICWKSTNEASSFTALTAWSLPNSIGYNHADVHGLFWVNNNIYSISDGGLFKSADAGDNWTDLSAGLGIRQFYRIANSQTNPNVITGGAQDNGTVARQSSGTWVDWLGADGMEGLVSPTNHLRLWGTSQNGSIYRSTNGGSSYSNLTKPANGDWVTPIAIHPTDETILYGGWTGVWKSVNSGSNWTNISSGVITTTVADLAIAPSAPTTIYASKGATLYVTFNDGLNWTVRTAPSTINDIAIDPTNPSKIWIACNSSTNRVFVSTDAGANFTNISSNLPSIVARTIVVDDNTPRGLYVGMNIGVYTQEEGTGSWTDFSDNLPMVAINELDIQKSSGVLRVATYGRGVWETPITAAPLVNDDASGAILLALGSGCTGAPYSNQGATQSGGEPFAACKGTAGYKTVWYKFIAPASGSIRVSTDYSGGTMGNDSRLSLFSATNVNNYATFTNIACDDDNGATVANKSILYATGLTSGATYYIQVDGYDASIAEGTFCITVDELGSSMLSTSTACSSGQSLSSFNNNYAGWVSATDATGKLIALISNLTGGTGTSSYTHNLNINSAAIRQDAVSLQYYLNRNFLINNSSVTNATVRLFFLNTELTSLQAADPGVTLSNLQVTRQSGTTCQANFIAANGFNSSLAQTGNGSGSGFSWIQITTPGFSNFYLHTKKAFLPVRTYLQGAFNSAVSRHKDVSATWATIMNTNALTQPYNFAPFNYSGTESVSAGFFTSSVATTDIVDWVLLELRDAVTPATVITSRAAFIREDGRIVDLDGVSDVSFRNVADGNYHLVIMHRNHLAIRTATGNARTLNGSLGFALPSLFDFSISQSQAYQNIAITGNTAMRDLAPGIFGMWGGNGNSDGFVRATGLASQNDFLSMLSAMGNNPAAVLSNIYNRADMNLDGTVRASGLASVNDYLFLLSALDFNPAKIVTQHQ